MKWREAKKIIEKDERFVKFNVSERVFFYLLLFIYLFEFLNHFGFYRKLLDEFKFKTKRYLLVTVDIENVGSSFFYGFIC